MVTDNRTYLLFCKYAVIRAVILLCFSFNALVDTASGQDLRSIGAYRTALAMDGIGEWNDPSVWEIWDGTLWNPASDPPGRNNDVFIEKDKEVRLTQNEEVGNFYLFASAEAGKKLNLQVYELSVYGALRCFTREIDGTYSLHNSTSLTEDWIYPETGNIVFKGTTRTVVDRSSWSGNNGQSRFGVIFNPDPEDTLTVNAVFKASSFIVQSGTVVQKVNFDGTPATSTFSFNIQDKISLSAYGDFTIEPGATLISEATKSFGEIIMRTENRPAANFHLKEGGTLILLGEEPIMEAENILLEGNVYYSGTSGTQQFISGSMAGVADPITYNHLFFDGIAAKDLPDNLELKGDLTFLGGGAVNGIATAIHFTGTVDQEVKNIALDLKEANIAKPSGILFLDEDLIINDQFAMTAGEVDFRNNQLYINGGYHYTSGSWSNLSRLLYQNIPAILNPSNSTFPFVDAYLGGVRKIVLFGTQSASNTDLNIAYHQLPGVNWDPSFDDGDAPILYKLNSYFTFTLESDAPTDQLEILMAADNLIVVDDDHLRIVGDDAAAPGNHLGGMDNMAGREINLNDLDGQTLTIGSTGTASILPVTWLSYQAEELPNGNLISWSTAKEEDNKGFIILKSFNARDFDEIGHVTGKGYNNEVHQYQFLDRSINLSRQIYYQIKQVDFNGDHDSTPIFQLILKQVEDRILIFPNPYQNQKGRLTIRIPYTKAASPANIVVKKISGKSLIQEAGTLKQASQKAAEDLQELGPGLYLIIIETNGQKEVIKWLNEN